MSDTEHTTTETQEPCFHGRAVKIGVLLACIVLGLFLSYTWNNVRLDDAFIFLSYARNLINGEGYVFNVGEKVNGCTSALMPLLIAVVGFLPVKFLGADLWFIGRIIDGLLLGVLFFLLFLLSVRPQSDHAQDSSRDTTGRAHTAFAWLITVLLLVSNERFAHGTGMESYLVLVLQVGCVCAYFYGYDRLSACLAGLTPLARPDAICVPAVLFVYDLVNGRKFMRFGNVGRACAPLIAWLVFSYLYFGELLPESTAAKLAQTESGRWGRGLIFLGGFSKWRKSFGFASLAVIPLVVCLGVARIRVLLKDNSTLILVGGYVLYLGMYISVLNPPPYQWYYVPAVLLFALVGGYALTFRHRAARVVCVTVLLCLAGRTIESHISKPISDKYTTYRAGAAYLNSAYPTNTTIAANEIGVLRYFYERGSIVDGLGLTSKGGLEEIKNRQYAWYIRDYKPRVLFFSNPPRIDLEGFVSRDWFRKIYKRVKVAWVDSSGVVRDDPGGDRVGGFTLYERVVED